VFPAPSASTTYKLFTTLVVGTAVSTAVAAFPYSTTINTPLLTTSFTFVCTEQLQFSLLLETSCGLIS
jgi:hypothetical protein